jgi:ribosomal protein S18 acetylase RimI-like enzyme
LDALPRDHQSASYSIRPARAEDLPRLPEIERAATQLFRHSQYSKLADDSGPDLETFEEWQRRGAIWVAVDSEDNVVGFAVAGEVDGQGFLVELDVHPDHGRRGLGRRLIETARRWTVEQGYEVIRLSTFVDIEWNAPYYSRLGFRILAEAELGPGLLEVRSQEAEAGLDVARRVFMMRPAGK